MWVCAPCDGLYDDLLFMIDDHYGYCWHWCRATGEISIAEGLQPCKGFELDEKIIIPDKDIPNEVKQSLVALRCGVNSTCDVLTVKKIILDP